MSNILVIEDDVDFRRLLSTFLTEQGYDVTSADDGREGLKLFEEVHPDIVLSDIRMPKKDGLDLLLKFRNHSKHKPKGIILMSGFNNTRNETYMETLKSLGATDFFQKPFSLTHLKERIVQIMES